MGGLFRPFVVCVEGGERRRSAEKKMNDVSLLVH